MATVLCTGAAGFIGTNAVLHLHDARGFDVKGFDSVPESSLNPVLKDKMSYVQGDLRNLHEVAKAMKGCDCVLHIGAIGDVYACMQKPYLAAEVNVAGTANVCEAAIENQVKTMIYISSWEVVGEPEYQPIDELHPCHPDHPYNVTKYAGELLVKSYCHLKGLNGCVIRLGSAYGLYMRPNGVIPLFIRRAKAKQPITLQGGGLQGRQWLHATDAARAFALALDGKCRNGESYNVVSDEYTTIAKIAELVTAAFPTEIKHEPARPGDVPPAQVSNKKFKSETGWIPQMTFEKGMAELIDRAKSA